LSRIQNVEAVTVCVGYSDFLKETAKYNIPLFDNWIIVTEPQDEATRELCRKLNLHCILSEDGKRHGGADGFAKGRLVERGLQHLSKAGYRTHIDADMALPYNFRHSLESSDPQDDMVYGIDRILVYSWEDWKKIQASGYLQGGQYDYKCRVNFAKGFDVGTRWAHPEMGYVPIGFFQLWHSSQDDWRGVRVKPYPMKHGNACRTDVQHSMQWDRHKRALLPEIIGVHIESERSKMGANWKGRTTKPFGSAEDLKKNEIRGKSYDAVD
jgi:hypothetical protein